MNPQPALTWLDLHRLSDYALAPAELRPLVQTLSDDLTRQTRLLEQALSEGFDAQALHQILHAIKGMAGMFARPDLHQALAEADEACRRGDLRLGQPTARALLPALKGWQAEILSWLQRYS